MEHENSLFLNGNGIKTISSTALFSLKSLRHINLSFNDLQQISLKNVEKNMEKNKFNKEDAKKE